MSEPDSRSFHAPLSAIDEMPAIDKMIALGAHKVYLRDLFAGLAMQGYIAAGDIPVEMTFDDVAEKAFRMADSMIEAREKSSG